MRRFHPIYFCTLLAFLPVEAIAEKVGVLLPLSGEVAAFGAKVRAGIESSSHDGVEFVYEDDACSASKALTGYRSLGQRGIKYFLGPCCGASMKTVAPNFAASRQLSFATCPISDEAHAVSRGRVLIVTPLMEMEPRLC